MKRLFLLLFVFTFLSPIYAQTISGKVFDSVTKEPLAFANFTFNENQRLATSSDIDGKFSFSGLQPITTLTCTYMGYETQTIQLKQTKNIIIYLKASENNLEEVVIRPSENPANAIIRKVIANK